jgi:hypothetical protein
MFARWRDPSELRPLGDAEAGDVPSFELDGFSEGERISLRNCWLFMAANLENVWRSREVMLGVSFVALGSRDDRHNVAGGGLNCGLSTHKPQPPAPHLFVLCTYGLRRAHCTCPS